MSLVGNLEDLSLGDLLQIVSLSQKSGVLALESPAGSGQIVFRSGLVHSAGVKGRSPDLRGLLVQAGLIDDERFDAALSGSRPGKTATLSEHVAARAGLDLEQVEAQIRKSIEEAIFEMFSWTAGEFSFDARREEEGDDLHPGLRSGINAQYLAMEGMRLRDEEARAEPAPEIELADELFFGPEALEVDPDAELELDMEIDAASSRPVRPSRAPTAESGRDGAPPSTAAPVRADLVSEAVDLVAAQAATGSGAVATTPPTPSHPESRPVVVIEPDAAALEWIKSSTDGRFARVHVFQRAEEGLARIRQYLIRGEVPLVLISPSAPIDPLSGIHGLADFVKRLRNQAPRILVVGLREESEEQPAAIPASLEAVITRPSRLQLRPGSTSDSGARAQQFVRELAEVLARRAVPATTPPAAMPKAPRAAALPAGADALGESAAILKRAQSRNDVFAVVLDAAARLFARAAILVLRDGEVFAVAGRGIEALEVDPLAPSPRLSCPVHAGGLVRQVVDSDRPVTGRPRSAPDRMLVAMFGPIEPKLAYLAPLRGPGGALALLYADAGASRGETPDTGALERLLSLATEVLDGIAVERTKGEARSTAS